eukprot:NODE_71_length_23666_cov_0.239403.p4 type:complete len:686 gc:universal NODE_71_length_23666_cov_0.239403:18750-16693(-)
MLQDQLAILEKKEESLLEFCKDPTIYVTTVRVQESLNKIRDDFEDLNDILLGIDSVSKDVKSKLFQLDVERKNILKLKESINSLTSFKFAVLRGYELAEKQQYDDIFSLFENTSHIPDFKRLDVIPPKSDKPIQTVFTNLQEVLLQHLSKQKPTAIYDLIQLLKNYFTIYKENQGISVFIKSVKIIFDEQLQQIQQQPIEPIMILIKCMDAFSHLIVKLYNGLHDKVGDRASFLFFDKFYKYVEDLISQLLSKWQSTRNFNKLVAELKTLELTKREDGILVIDSQVDLKELSKYCIEMSSVMDRFYKLVNFSELHKLYDFKKSVLTSTINEIWHQYKVIEVVYIQSCFSKFFINFKLSPGENDMSIVEDSIHLLKASYMRATLLGNPNFIDDMLYCLSTISNRLLIDNLVEMFKFSLRFEHDEMNNLPLLLLQEMDDFNNKLDSIHNDVIQHVGKLKSKYDDAHVQAVEQLFIKRFDWNFKSDQLDTLINQFYNNQLKRSLTVNCKKLFRDIVKVGNSSKYMVAVDVNNTMMESRLLGNNPTLDVILNVNFGEFSTFKNDVFVRLLMESVDVIVDRYVDAVYECSMNLKGAAFFEKDTRSLQKALDDYFHKNCTSDLYFIKHQLLRGKFSKLLEIAIIVNCETISEVNELIHDPSYQWQLTTQEMRKCLLLRNDFRIEDVAKLKI